MNKKSVIAFLAVSILLSAVFILLSGIIYAALDNSGPSGCCIISNVGAEQNRGCNEMTESACDQIKSEFDIDDKNIRFLTNSRCDDIDLCKKGCCVHYGTCAFSRKILCEVPFFFDGEISDSNECNKYCTGEIPVPDNDKDGVKDGQDFCPDTQDGASSNENGCSERQQKVLDEKSAIEQAVPSGERPGVKQIPVAEQVVEKAKQDILVEPNFIVPKVPVIEKVEIDSMCTIYTSWEKSTDFIINSEKSTRKIEKLIDAPMPLCPNGVKGTVEKDLTYGDFLWRAKCSSKIYCSDKLEAAQVRTCGVTVFDKCDSSRQFCGNAKIVFYEGFER